jgi:hypothetical protein
MERYEEFEHFDPTNNYNANGGGGTEMNEYMGALEDAEGGLQGSIDQDQAGGNGWRMTNGARGNYGTVDNALYQNENNFGLFNKTAPYMEPSQMRKMPVLDDFGMSGLDPMSSKNALLTGGSKKKKKSKKKVSKKKVSKKKVSKKKVSKKKVSKKKKDSVNKIKNFFDDLF